MENIKNEPTLTFPSLLTKEGLLELVRKWLTEQGYDTATYSEQRLFSIGEYILYYLHPNHNDVREAVHFSDHL